MDGTTLKVTLVGPPAPRGERPLPGSKHSSQVTLRHLAKDSDMVREARREFFSKHSYNFTTDGTHNLSRTFRQLAVSPNLLSTSIHEIQASWPGPEELKQANYAFQSLPKGLKFLCALPPSGSPKVMALVGIHDPDALCHFGSITYCPWCGKEGQNEGTMVNLLQTMHYRLGLMCNRCYDCLSTMSDTLHHHGWHECCQLGENVPSKLVPSE